MEEDFVRKEKVEAEVKSMMVRAHFLSSEYPL